MKTKNGKSMYAWLEFFYLCFPEYTLHKMETVGQQVNR